MLIMLHIYAQYPSHLSRNLVNLNQLGQSKYRLHELITMLRLLKLAALVALPISALPSAPNTRKTTTLPNGQVIDWIPISSQGKIASPPPLPPKRRQENLTKQPHIASLTDPSLSGPAGTVPIVRANTKQKYPKKRLPTHDSAVGESKIATGNAGQHWYASSGEAVDNHGGGAVFSLYKAFVENPLDFSLIQTAVIRDGAANTRYGNVTQTVESGWMNYPGQMQGPHLFTYFTSVGYQQDVDNLGGWNRDVAGWIQTDKDIYPGLQLSPLSVDGGAQYDLHIEYKLFQGNWWLFVLDRYIGYYPASLFSKGVDPASTLADHSSLIDFYGEIYNSGNDLTTTDMGSGLFPESGFGHAAYMHNIVYTDLSDKAQHYDGSAHIQESDRNRYRISPSFKSGTSWGSFVFLGGPGAGGVTGG